MNDQRYLLRALELAKESFEKGSVPIGALIVDDKGEVVAQGFNEIKIIKDPTAHAEVVCMRKANEKVIKTIYPEATTLYTTLEPCFACSFFITRTNIARVVWALNDPYKGGIEYLLGTDKMKDDLAKLVLVSEPDEVLKKESKNLMKQYYLKKGDNKVAELFS